MDNDLNNIIMKTSMETFLVQKLKEQTILNERLSYSIMQDGMKLSPEDALLLKEVKGLMHKIVKMPHTEQRQRELVAELSYLFTGGIW
jgi:hypothetical protein